MQSAPVDIFEIQNAGNIIPVLKDDSIGYSLTLEYAVHMLKKNTSSFVVINPVEQWTTFSIKIRSSHLPKFKTDSNMLQNQIASLLTQHLKKP